MHVWSFCGFVYLSCTETRWTIIYANVCLGAAAALSLSLSGVCNSVGCNFVGL